MDNIYQQLRLEEDESAYIDSFVSAGRHQDVQSSTHAQKREEKLAVGLLADMQNVPKDVSENDKRKYAEEIKAMLKKRKSHLQNLRQDIQAIEKQHKKTPYTYIGVETPPDELEHWDQMVEVVVELQKAIKQVLGKYFTDQDIDNLSLLILGDEDYLRLPGKILAGLPTVAMEDPQLFENYSKAANGCILLSESAKEHSVNNEIDDPIRVFIDSVFALPLSHDIAAYKKLENTFLQQTQKARSGDTELNRVLQEMIGYCQDTRDPARDEFMAKKMTTSLPKGRGIIFRGHGHRVSLTQAYLNQCRGENSVSTPQAAPADKGIE